MNSNLSNIVVKDADPTGDTTLIGDYLFDEKRKYFRSRILNFYKDLNIVLATQTFEQSALLATSFFSQIYEKKKSDINDVVEQSRLTVQENSEICLDELARLMDYEGEKSETYFAIPTLLPFSPFNRPVFYFSIVHSLFKKSKNEILDIAIHEISHFWLFDILDKINIDLQKNEVDRNFLHLFKEALTGMLLSEESMMKVLNNKDYRGNPEVWNLNIATPAGPVLSLREYLRTNLHIFKAKSLSFEDFISGMISELQPLAGLFSQKKVFWNMNEREIRQNTGDAY